MYQLMNNQTTDVFHISSIIPACNNDSRNSDFLFFQSNNQWYQTYIDESVLFINALQDMMFNEYLSDLEQEKLLELNLYDGDSFVLKYQNSSLIFFGKKYVINFNIKNEKFLLKNFVNISC